MPAEPDLATDDGLVERGYAAIARSARLLRLDLAGHAQGVRVGRGVMPVILREALRPVML